MKYIYVITWNNYQGGVKTGGGIISRPCLEDALVAASENFEANKDGQIVCSDIVVKQFKEEDAN